MNQLPRGLQGPSRGSPGTPQGPSRGCPGYQNGFCYHLIQRCSTQQADRKLARVLSCIPGGSKPSFKRSGRRETGLTKKLQKQMARVPSCIPDGFKPSFKRSGRRASGLTKRIQQQIGESPVLYPRYSKAEFQTLWPQSDRPDQKALEKNGESLPVSQVVSSLVSLALAAE